MYRDVYGPDSMHPHFVVVINNSKGLQPRAFLASLSPPCEGNESVAASMRSSDKGRQSADAASDNANDEESKLLSGATNGNAIDETSKNKCCTIQ